ncbi:MAG: DNA-deoxyinosine glycosylase [Gallionella sp.]
MPRVRCFAAVIDPDASVLILGSMPGKASLAADQYYAHPRNVFWVIMGELVGAYPELPYEDRLKILRSRGIALWDVLGSCVRKSSLDAHIEMDSAVPGDFKSFFRQHPHITEVFFNGTKAEQCFLKYVLPTLKPTSLRYQRLPSTSPANAGISYEQKLLAWKSVVRFVRNY